MNIFDRGKFFNKVFSVPNVRFPWNFEKESINLDRLHVHELKPEKISCNGGMYQIFLVFRNL